eukprot:6207571-Pleurochrysis_carterae.AAC.2
MSFLIPSMILLTSEQYKITFISVQFILKAAHQCHCWDWQQIASTRVRMQGMSKSPTRNYCPNTFIHIE